MEKSNFDHLLERYLSDQLSEEERNKVDAWLDSRKTKEERNLVWNKEDEERLFRRITSRSFGIDDMGTAFSPPTVSSVRTVDRRSSRWLAMAAGLALLAVVSFAVWRAVDRVQNQVEFLTTTDQKRVILSDGSIVWLSPRSKLTFFKNTVKGERYAELFGEALFEIAKDPQHPFNVRCGDVTATVLGTSFTIRTTEGGIELNVLTGKVNLSSKNDPLGSTVLPFEKVRYIASGIIEKKPLMKSEVMILTDGTEYNLEFQNVSMDKVMDKVSKKFDITVSLENPELKQCRITADFTDRSLESTLQMLSELLELSYTMSGKSVSIKGKGCK